MTHAYALAGLLLLASWLLPLHVLPWMSWHNEIVASLAALGGGLLASWRRREPLPVPGLVLLPLLLAALAAAQFAGGRIVHAGSLWTVFSYATLAIVAATAGLAAGRGGPPVPSGTPGAPAPVDLLAQVLLAGAILQVPVVFGQTLGLWDGFEWVARTSYLTRGGGNLAQPNQAGLLFVMGIAAGLYLHHGGRLGRPVTIVLLLMLCAGLATTESRSAQLGLGAVVGWHLLRRRDLPAGSAWLLAALALCAVLLFLAWPRLAAQYWFLDGTEGVNLTTSGRTKMWPQLLEAVRLRPWFGWGVMQVAEAQEAIAHRYPEALATTFSHNVALDLALWIGLPATLLVAWMAWAWLRARLPRTHTAAAIFCVAVVLPMAVQSLTEFPYAYAYFLLPAFFALGLLDAWTGPPARLRLAGRWPLGLLGVALALHLWAAVEYVRIEEDFRVARFQALKVGKSPAAHEPARVLLLTQLDALLRATRLEPRPGMAPEEIELLGSVARLYPWGAPNFRYLTALALNGRIDEANRQLLVLRSRHGKRMYETLVPALEEMAVEHPALKQLQLH